MLQESSAARTRVILTWPNGTKGGGPPSAPMLLRLCLARLCGKTGDISRWLYTSTISAGQIVPLAVLIKVGESVAVTKMEAYPLQLPLFHHVFNHSSKDGDFWVIEQQKAIFNLNCTEQLHFRSRWGIKTANGKQKAINTKYCIIQCFVPPKIVKLLQNSTLFLYVVWADML